MAIYKVVQTITYYTTAQSYGEAWKNVSLREKLIKVVDEAEDIKWADITTDVTLEEN